MTHERIAGVFDAWAVNGRAESMERGHGDVVRQVVERMRFEPGQAVLDLGCGNGWATRLMAGRAPGIRGVGVDCAPAMVRRARMLSESVSEAGGHGAVQPTSRPEFVVARFEALPFVDGAFGNAFSMEAIYYAVDLERALVEIARVLGPGGTIDLVLDCFAESPSTRGWSRLVGLPMHCLSEAEWCRALGRAGFVDARARRVLDSRGPGAPTEFRPSAHAPDWETQVALHAAGSLWLSAHRA
jgi:ubiquinone/menaquinone biosynthesis C-methylase UbiE